MESQNETKNTNPHPPQEKKNQEIIKELIIKEAQITKTENKIRQNKKRVKQIKNSKTWKYGKAFQNVNPMQKRAKEQYMIDELKKELQEKENELYQIKDLLHEAMLDDRKLNGKDIVSLMRQKKEEGKLLDFIDKAIHEKRQHEANYNDALRYAARLFMNDKEEYKDLIYLKILAALKNEDIPEFMIRAGLTESPISLNQVASFRGSLNTRIRQKQLLKSLPEWNLDDKEIAYDFVDTIQVKRPWVSKEKYALADIPKKDGIVIKPADGAGSRGVYLVYTEKDIFDLKRSKSLASWDELLESMKTDLDTSWVDQDEWLIEELILESIEKQTPASDIKFYCFYGKVGLILEITRVPEVQYCWWTATGERIRTGKYDDSLFKGKGASSSEIEQAEKVSSMIPAPFIRIDFLRSEDGLIFGEFTPKPGNYDEFDEPTDRWLGDMFIEAQGRLDRDLLDGKEFKEFKNFLSSQHISN